MTDRLKHALKWAADNPLLLCTLASNERRERTKRAIVYIHARNKRDPLFRLLNRMRSRLKAATKAQRTGKWASTMQLVGCDPAHLRQHLESQFKTGMTWANHGKWHIDHIRPCASFDLRQPAQQRECFHFTNLQPLWATDNHCKSDRWQGKSSRKQRQ